MADGRHIKNHCGCISAPYWPIKAKFGDKESHANIGHVNKMAIFANSRWRTAVILKTFFVSWRHFSRCVWKLGGRCRIACKQMSRDQNSNFRQFNMAAAAMLKVVFQRLGIPIIPVMN